MIDNSGHNWEERQPVKSPSNWPTVVGIVVVVVVLLGAIGVLAWKLGWLSNLGLFSKWSTPEVTSITPSETGGDLLPVEKYEWRYDGQPWELNLRIPKSLYDYYSGMERAPVEDYSLYVTHPLDDSFIATVAAELDRQATIQDYDAEQTVNFVASFVQNLTYTEDIEGEYPNYPVETLYDRGGDCEDTAILTAALLQAMDYDAVLIRFDPVRERDAGHMAVGVAVTGVSGGYSYTYDGEKYYYLETTSTSWTVGEIPSEYEGKSDGIYGLVPVPALRFADFAWGSNNRLFSKDTIYLEVTVTNWGTANADAFYVRAFFEGHQDGAKQSDTYDLAYGYQISGVTTKGIAVPSGGGTLLVELWLDGEVVDDWSVDIS